MPWSWRKRSKPAETYSGIAPFYDYLMRHVNYPRWFEYLTDILNRHLLHQRRVLELACGTGKMLEKFAGAGWEVFGLDRSPAMLAIARQRLQASQPSAHLWVGDMRRFAVKQPMDAVICLYDSLNYCLTLDEVEQVFEHVHAVLATGGVFIFDVVTQRNCKRNFRDFYEHDQYENYEYIRQSHFDFKNEQQINEFMIKVYDGGVQRVYERHVQRIYRLQQIESSLKKFPWEILGIFDNFSRRPGTEKSDRVHFVIRKP